MSDRDMVRLFAVKVTAVLSAFLLAELAHRMMTS